MTTTPLTEDLVRHMAVDDAVTAVVMAQESTEPICWITGNNFMPPLRAFGQAETVWQADAEDEDGSLWEIYVEAFESFLERSNVYLDAPEYDNALYVVDTARWAYVEEAEGDSLNDEWIAVV